MAKNHSNPQECRDRAASCERLAKTATTPENREIMQYLARRWLALAEEEEAKLQSPEPHVRSRLTDGVRDGREDSE
jgi:hypothetical protein